MIFAISIAVPASAPNPRTAAIRATTRNVMAQLIMIIPFPRANRPIRLCGHRFPFRQRKGRKRVPQAWPKMSEMRAPLRGDETGSIPSALAGCGNRKRPICFISRGNNSCGHAFGRNKKLLPQLEWSRASPTPQDSECPAQRVPSRGVTGKAKSGMMRMAFMQRAKPGASFTQHPDHRGWRGESLAVFVSVACGMGPIGLPIGLMSFGVEP